MRYVGNDQDEFDDDDEFEDDDDFEDDDAEDDDSPKPRSNPFTTGLGQQRSSSLPGAGRSPAAGTGGSSNLPGSRLPGSTGPNRPASPTSPSGSAAGGSNPPRYGGTPGGSGSSSGQNPPSGSRFGSPSSPQSSGGSSGSSSGGSSPFNTRYSPGQSGSSAQSASSPLRPGSPTSPPPKPGSGGDRKDEKSGGGLGSRFGGGSDKDKKDNKPAASSGGGGGLVGGLTSRFGSGGKESKPGAPSKPGDNKESGGILGRFRPGQKEEPKRTTGTSSSVKPGGSPFSSSGAKPPTPGGSPLSSSSSAAPGQKRPTFGGAGGGTSTGTSARVGTPKSEARTGLGRFLPFGGAKEEKRPVDKKVRPSKAPRVESGGLTLDNKLDILGVTLTLSSLVLLLSRLSATKGALAESVNSLLTQTFGWGALAIPVAMMAVGIWLIARHFGDEAPVVPTGRIFGIVLAYVGILLVMQFIDTFSYINNSGSPVTMDELQGVWLPISIARGTGGGWIGANLYYLLASNLTEYGAFLAAVGLLIIGTMFILSLSAAELAMIVVSIVRSFGDARQRRAQRQTARAAALPLEQLNAQTARGAPSISVTRPEPEALPAGGSAPALPATSGALPLPETERSININVGGRNVASPYKTGEMVAVQNTPAGGKPQPGMSPAKASDKAAAPAPSGGFGSRLRGALPGIGRPGAKPNLPETGNPTKLEPARAQVMDKTVEKTAEKSGSPMGMVRGLFNRQTAADKPPAPTGKPGTSATPASPVKPASSPATASAASASLGQSAQSPVTARTAPASDEEPARLGDLLKPATAPAGRPTTQTAPVSPVNRTATPAAPPPRTSPLPATPAAASPLNRAPAAGTAGAPFGASASPLKSPLRKPEDMDDEEDDEFDEFEELDEFDEFDEIEDIDAEDEGNLAPAKPKGTGGLPRPETNPPRFGAPAGVGSSAEGTGNRQDRLNVLRSGQGSDALGNQRLSPTPAQPASPMRPAATVVPQGAPRSDAGSRLSPIPSAPAGDQDKKPQPSAAFWKPGGDAPKVAELPKADLPKPEVKPPASSYGKPTTPPGAPVIMPPVTSATSTPRAANAPMPPSPEIALRQPGVGTTAPAGAKRRKDWKLPSYASLLMPGSEGDIDRESLLRRARIIEDTLNSFGAPGKVVEVNTGPVITQFGVEPDYLVTRGGKKNRVKVSAIAQLDKDIQLALGARSIRIEAPVPGKGYVGIEVPNDAPSLVSLRDVMESDAFKRIKSPLVIALGQSVDGAPISADLTGMPHLLIAGTTGSGKSVLVNAIITSLLIQNPPDRVKFIMVDPKRVELTGYNGIPHLVAPVVVDLERIVGVLKWVTREMDERYKRFSNAGARNIEDFNNHLSGDAEFMPYIIVIVDELADLMMLAPDETERVITRIAALARATGIHLVIATQRPSVDVVTGLIKANFPARIAFAVASGVDSRVILDQPGAERLLGRGDMLYMSGDSPAPLRLQGVFVSDTEINNIARYWKSQMSETDTQAKPITTLVLDHSIVESSRSVSPNNDRDRIQQAFWESEEKSRTVTTGNGTKDDDIPEDQEDELYEEAVEMVRRLNKASVSLLQRRLRIGYTRAARLIDRMEEENIIGPAVEGSKPREVLPPR